MVRRLVDSNRRREQRRQSRLLDRLERQFARRFQAEIARAMRELAEQYRLTGEVGVPRDHLQNIEAIFRQLATTSAEQFGARIIDQGKAAGYKVETKDFAATMARLALSYIDQEAIRQRITSITSTTRQQVINAVSAGYSDGLGQNAIANLILERVPDFSAFRGRMIARTETHGAANFGAREAARETGLPLRKEWIAAQDERTRQSHADADGQVVGQDETFDVGGSSLEYPGDPAGPAEEVINCRCALGWIVPD
jgi:uncharacterized protein with gpF-like domain